MSTKHLILKLSIRENIFASIVQINELSFRSISFQQDFWAMFVHHVVTLCLLGFSWACNLVRMGTLVLLIHDFADIPLEVRLRAIG